jgi:hypothetical protein
MKPSRSLGAPGALLSLLTTPGAAHGDPTSRVCPQGVPGAEARRKAHTVARDAARRSGSNSGRLKVRRPREEPPAEVNPAGQLSSVPQTRRMQKEVISVGHAPSPYGVCVSFALLTPPEFGLMDQATFLASAIGLPASGDPSPVPPALTTCSHWRAMGSFRLLGQLGWMIGQLSWCARRL